MIKLYFIHYLFFAFSFLAGCASERKQDFEDAKIITAQNSSEVFLVKDMKAVIGEGAFWNYQTQELWWIDINGKKMYIYDPSTKEQEEIHLEQRIGTVVPTTRSGEALIALEDGVYFLDLETKKQTLLAPHKEVVNNLRLNDGKCDPAGRLWVGSMELNAKPNVAALYRIESSGEITQIGRAHV